MMDLLLVLDCHVLQCTLSDYILFSLTILMQELQQIFKIEEIEKKDSLLEVLSDKYCRRIVESILDIPKSVMEISHETKIPISTVYRRIQMLHDNRLLHVSGQITEDKKKLFLYKSKIKGIQSRYDDGNVEVELILNNN